MKHEGKNCIYHKKDSHRVLLTEPVGKTAAHQAPPSMGFSKQECWSGVPLPSPIHVFYETLKNRISFF